MSGKDETKRLPLWEDSDLDFDRAKRNGEEWAKSATRPIDLRAYLQKEKERYDALEKNFKWR